MAKTKEEFEESLKDLKLATGNTKYVEQNLEFMEFIQKNNCKTKELKHGRK